MGCPLYHVHCMRAAEVLREHLKLSIPSQAFPGIICGLVNALAHYELGRGETSLLPAYQEGGSGNGAIIQILGSLGKEPSYFLIWEARQISELLQCKFTRH